MIRKLIAALVLLSAAALGQVTNYNLPDCIRNFSFQVTGGVITGSARAPVYDNRVLSTGQNGAGCTSWTLVYTASGVTSPSIEIDQAPDSGGQAGSWSVWPSAQVIGTLPLTTANFGQVNVYSFAPWVSVNMNSASGTGTIYGTLYGWRTGSTSDSSAGASPVNPAVFAYKHIASATNTQVKSIPGYLHTVTINGGTAGLVTVVDTSAANCTGGNTIAIIQAIGASGTVPPTLFYDVVFNNGLCITTAAATDVTVSSK